MHSWWSRPVFTLAAVALALPLSSAPAVGQAAAYAPDVAASYQPLTGVVVGWGYAGLGRLDVPVSAQTDATAVVTLSRGAAALVDGGVVVWGAPSDKGGEVPGAARSGVTAIASGYSHLLALKSGEVLAWGDGGHWGATDVPADARSGVTAISANKGYSLALKDGRVIGWGDNTRGQLDIPEEAQSGVDAIAAGFGHALALKDGRVIAWGQDNSSHATEVPDEALSGVDQIAAGDWRSMALKAGKVIGWGVGFNDGDEVYLPEATRSGVDALETKANLAVVKDGAVIRWATATLGGTEVSPEATRDVTAVSYGDGGAYLAIRQYPLGIPRQVTGTSGPGTVALTWIATVPRWGSVTGYRVESAPRGSDDWTVRIADTGSPDPRATVTGLAVGAPVRFRVTALEGSRLSPTSEPSQFVVPGDAAATRMLPVSLRTADGVALGRVRWTSYVQGGAKLDEGKSDVDGRFSAKARLTSGTTILFDGEGGLTGSVTIPPWEDRLDIRTPAAFYTQVDATDAFGAPLWRQWGSANTTGGSWPRQRVAGQPELFFQGLVNAPYGRVGPTGRDGRLVVTASGAPLSGVVVLSIGDAIPPTAPVRAEDLRQVAENRVAGTVRVPDAVILEDAVRAGLPPGPSTTTRTTLTPSVVARTPGGKPIATTVGLYAVPVPADPLQGVIVAADQTDPLTGRVSFPDLAPGRYWAVVQNAASRIVEFVVPARVPYAPESATVAETTSGVRIRWAPPENNGGSQVTGYTVIATPGGRTWRTTGTGLTVNGLKPGREYMFQVRAENALGLGAASIHSPSIIYRSPVTIRAKAVKDKSQLFLDVDPNLGKGSWTVTIQKRRANGTWRADRDLKTKGASETLTVDLPRGTYRARIRATPTSQAAVSVPVWLTR